MILNNDTPRFERRIGWKWGKFTLPFSLKSKRTNTSLMLNLLNFPMQIMTLGKFLDLVKGKNTPMTVKNEALAYFYIYHSCVF